MADPAPVGHGGGGALRRADHNVGARSRGSGPAASIGASRPMVSGEERAAPSPARRELLVDAGVPLRPASLRSAMVDVGRGDAHRRSRARA